MSARNMPAGSGVDLEREERLRKGEECIQQFRAVWESPIMKKIADKKNDVMQRFLFLDGKFCKEITNRFRILFKSM